MASIEIHEIEAQLDHRMLFNVRLEIATGRIDFPVAIVDQGSEAANEAAVLNAALGVGEQIAVIARNRLKVPLRN